MKNQKMGASTQVNKVVRVTATNKAIQVTSKKEKVTYLAEGVTGKQMMKSIYKANNEHKKDLGSYSQCMKRAIEFGKDEFKATIKGFNVKDLTPSNIIPLRNAKKTSENAWSVYEVLMLIKKYYQTK
jgi:hypothetical protein